MPVALLEQPDARLQLALIPLLLRHPELASRVPLLVTQIEPRLAIELQTLYMAAVDLQRLWKTRPAFTWIPASCCPISLAPDGAPARR